MFEPNDATVQRISDLMELLGRAARGAQALDVDTLVEVPLELLVALQRVLTETDVAVETGIRTTYGAIQHHPER